MQHGRSLQSSLEALRAERTATLAQGQVRTGAGNLQAELFMALGLGEEFAQQHPGLEGLLAQVQGLVLQIKSQGQQDGPTQPGVPATLVDSPTQEPSGAPDLAPPGGRVPFVAGQRKGGLEVKEPPGQTQRVRSRTPTRFKAEDVVEYSAKDLGLEGDSAEAYDNQQHDGQGQGGASDADSLP